jgi:hypothetical protein
LGAANARSRRQTAHVGLVDGDRIRSKWGIGHVWRHPRFEVPERYGDLILFFAPVKRAATVRAYNAYVVAKYGKVLIDRAKQKLDR